MVRSVIPNTLPHKEVTAFELELVKMITNSNIFSEFDVDTDEQNFKNIFTGNPEYCNINIYESDIHTWSHSVVRSANHSNIAN